MENVEKPLFGDDPSVTCGVTAEFPTELDNPFVHAGICGVCKLNPDELPIGGAPIVPESSLLLFLKLACAVTWL